MINRIQRHVTNLIVGMFVFLLPAAALAVPITFNFTGSVTSIPLGIAPAGVSIGTSVTGSYTFDSAATDSDLNASRGRYDSVGAPFGFVWNIGGNAYSQNRVTIFVNDNLGAGPEDVYQAAVSGSPGFPSPWFSVAMVDSTASFLSGTTPLPLTPPSLSAFDSTNMQHVERNSAGQLTLVINASVTSLTIPEPSTMLLLGFGLAGLGFMRSRRNIA